MGDGKTVPCPIVHLPSGAASFSGPVMPTRSQQVGLLLLLGVLAALAVYRAL
jgi:hypothetical protein